MKSRFRAYLAIIFVAAVGLFGSGLRLQFDGASVIRSGDLEAGIAELVFGLVVGGVGIAVLLFGWRYTRREAELAARAEAYPQQKWLWRREWTDASIADEASHPGAILFAMLSVAALSFATAIYSVRSGAFGQVGTRELVAFVVVCSAILVALSYVITRRRRLFGRLRLELDSVPVRPGSVLQGTVVTDIPPDLLSECSAEVSVICRRRIHTNLRRSHSTRTIDVWRSADASTALLGMQPSNEGRIVVPVSVLIPDTAPESTADYGSDAVEWVVECAIKVGNVSRRSVYCLPVFRVADTSSAPQEHALAMAGALETSPRTSVPGIRVSCEEGKTTIELGASRNSFFAGATALFGISWAMVVAYLAAADAPRLLTVAAGIFLVVPAYGLVSLWFERTRIVASRQGLLVERTIGPMAIRRFVPHDEVGDLLLSSFATVGSTNYFDLLVLTRRGRRIVVAGRQPGQSVAEWIGFQVNAALGRYNRVAFSGTVVSAVLGERPTSIADRGPIARGGISAERPEVTAYGKTA
ncbi:MAG: hypothetical protein KDD65_01750 [Bacteroidetes bacterium]|nr:hypothetical protein [Bacteroidota bacterium]